MIKQTRIARRATILTALAATLVAAAPASADAQALGCDASALRAALLTAPPIEPVTANRGAPDCETRTAGISLQQPTSPLTVDALAARTTSVRPAGRNDQQTAQALGGITDARVRALPVLPIQLPTAQLDAALGAVAVPLPVPAVPALPIPGVPALPSSITVDLRPALQALLPDGRLPNLDLVRVQTAIAYAGARCVEGQAVAAGDSRVAGLTVLGQELPVDQIANRVLNLNSASIDPSSVNPADVQLPPALSSLEPLRATVIDPAIQAVLDGLPNIAIPEGLASVRVTPGGQTTENGILTQRALLVQVTIAGQPLADVVLGEARVRTSAVDCDPPAPAVAPQTATDLALACTTRRLVLTDVVARRGRVRLVGAADRRLAGRTVTIRFLGTGRNVARARVRRDGSFQTTAAMPSRRIRNTNRARYEARLGRERSLNLKLARRMRVSGVSVRGGRVTIAGRVSRPLGSPVRSIRLTRRVSCRRSEVVRTFRPRRDGTFRVTVDAPDEQSAAVYRLGTMVRKNTTNRRHYPTFTLPRGVNLRQ